MATTMERIRQIARCEAAELKERFEDPERVINQTIADAMVSYASLRKELPPVTEAEARTKARLDVLIDEADRWHQVARKALAAGNEGDARTALSREVDLKGRITAQQGLYDQAHEVADALKAQLAAIEDGITQLQAKMARVKAKDAAARATDVAGTVSGGSGTLDRLEREADWHLAEAEGAAAAKRVAEGDPFEELLQAGADGGRVDEELAALREQLDAESSEDEDDD